MGTYGGVFRQGPSKKEFEVTDEMIAYANAFREGAKKDLLRHFEDSALPQFTVIGVLWEPPSITSKGIHLTQETKDDLKGSTKSFLIIAMGDGAFNETDEAYAVRNVFPKGKSPQLFDYVMARPCDGLPFSYAGVECKKFEDRQIIMKLPYPQVVF